MSVLSFLELPHRLVSHVDMVGCGLEILEGDTLGAQVEALRLITNNIIAVANNTFK